MTITRDFWIGAFVPLIGLVIVFAAWQTDTHGYDRRQQLNMAAANEELPYVEAILRGDERFRDVRASVHTGQCGSIWMTGFVSQPGDLNRLMGAIADMRLSVPVTWDVRVSV